MVQRAERLWNLAMGAYTCIHLAPRYPMNSRSPGWSYTEMLTWTPPGRLFCHADALIENKQPVLETLFSPLVPMLFCAPNGFHEATEERRGGGGRRRRRRMKWKRSPAGLEESCLGAARTRR